MQMSLGNFVFGYKGTGTAYQQLIRTTTQDYVKSARIGQRASNQSTGPGDDVLELPGIISPEICGKESTLSLTKLRALQATGQAQFLILINNSRGDIAGKWLILEIRETQSELLGNLPQKIEFTVRLRRDADDTTRAMYQ